MYEAYCDDFGPMNMSCIVEFIRLLDSLMEAWTDRKIVLCADVGRRSLTNLVFLVTVGAYMILKQNRPADEVDETAGPGPGRSPRNLNSDSLRAASASTQAAGVCPAVTRRPGSAAARARRPSQPGPGRPVTLSGRQGTDSDHYILVSES
jgi:hypothetical protein